MSVLGGPARLLFCSRRSARPESWLGRLINGIPTRLEVAALILLGSILVSVVGPVDIRVLGVVLTFCGGYVLGSLANKESSAPQEGVALPGRTLTQEELHSGAATPRAPRTIRCFTLDGTPLPRRLFVDDGAFLREVQVEQLGQRDGGASPTA